MALGLNSYYSKTTLQDENIRVLRHPDHAKVGIFLWAHHEKMVVVDQKYAFLGGIDLCYGRWDDHEHRLTDLGSVAPTLHDPNLKKKTSSAPSGDNVYSIPIPVFKQVQTPEIKEEAASDSGGSDQLDTTPYYEPEDYFLTVSRQTGNGKPTTPEVERKNLLVQITKKGKKMMNDVQHIVYASNEPIGSNELQQQTVEEPNEDLNGSAKYWIGKDYCNFIVKDFTNLDAPFTDFIDRTTTPRMPWHDIGVCVKGASAKDVARHFIQRWNATKLEKARPNNFYPYLLPKSYNDCYGDNANKSDVFKVESRKVTCQILRSVSTWSCGFLEPETVEQSIHEAYIDAITRSQHYIYIENQFFISLAQGNNYTRNQVVDALYKRILRAHK